MAFSLRSLLHASFAPARDVLVCLFQRGGADGLNSVVPHGDPNYYALRPRIAVPRPGQLRGAIDLDGHFGLNPALAPLKPAWDAGTLALLHATGVPHGTRSHFDAQALTEAGCASVLGLGSGWLGRHLAATASGADSLFRAVALGTAVPDALLGCDSPLALSRFTNFSLDNAGGSGYHDALGLLYPEGRVHAGVAHTALDTLVELEDSGLPYIQPDNGVVYPAGEAGFRLLQASQLIKAGLGTEIICADIGGWDHHDNIAYNLDGALYSLATALAAFQADMGGRMAGITVLVMTEFGRRVRGNASLGADHGTAGCAFALGGGVIGRQVATRWPGLAAGALAQGEDLAITIDLRHVLAQCLERRLGNADALSVFPEIAADGIPELFRAAA